MEVSFQVFRGGPEGRISIDTTTQTLNQHEVYIRTTHSGLCGTDEHFLKNGLVLGHEGVGVVEAVGSGVRSVKVGDRVGFGFTHEICAECDNCSSGWDQYCRSIKKYGSADRDNGTFSHGAVWDAKCVFTIPDGYESAHAAPLMCAGATIWTVLTEFGIRATDRVAIVGIGGLGHLAIKLAAAIGCQVVVLSSSESKRQEALDYGASEFHVYRQGEPFSPEFKPVKHLLVCGSSSVEYPSLEPLVDTLGSIYPITIAAKPAPLPLLQLLRKGIRIQTSLVGSRRTIRSLLEFVARNKITPTIMEYPLTVEGIETAMQELREGKVRYRAVLRRE